ncbi:CrcB family protein [Deinococcus sp. Leaf326]|uniref:fluoride efflux transporter FluC n=1 Tax=Deinococcus sp. Leaf326 TaxID=1736338 RepID=UPI0006F8D752|nr:CrcB family protein [Deinococcus sp. Leaf326]KQR15547.1 chromosome condensation protein CrcB [Deinococcus sp. Leaf326]
MKLSLWLWLLAGGALGAGLRQGVVLALLPLTTRTGLPLAVLAINVGGSFLLGLTLALVGRGVWPEAARVAFGTGVLGAFTTFSTFTTEIDGLLLRSQVAWALTYAAVSVVLGLGAAVAGRLLGARL